VTRVTFEDIGVRVDSEPLDAAAAAAVLTGTCVRHLPAKATDAGDGAIRLTIEVPCGGADRDGGRAAVGQRVVGLLEDALHLVRFGPAAAEQHLDRSPAPAGVDPDDGDMLSMLARLDRPVAQRGPHAYYLGPVDNEPGTLLEVIGGGLRRLSASAVAIRTPSTEGLEAALRFACELNHRLRIARIVAEPNTAAAQPHVRLTAECVAPLTASDATATIKSAAAAVAFTRARLVEAARGLADPAAAQIFLELRGIALEAEDRSKETGSPSLPRAAAP